MRCRFPEQTGTEVCPLEPFRANAFDFTCELCCRGVLERQAGLLVLGKALNVELPEKSPLDRAVEDELERRGFPTRDGDDGYPRESIFSVWNLLGS